MRYLDRPYDESAGDFGRVWDFLVRDYADRDGRVEWMVGRLADWKYNLATERKLTPLFTSRSAHLWLDHRAELRAFAINEDLRHRITVLVQAGFEHAYPIALDWAVDAWSMYARPWDPEANAPIDDPDAPWGTLVIEVGDWAAREAGVLTTRGWQDLGVDAVTRRFDVAAMARQPISLPDGYRLVTLAEDPNMASKLALHHDAWHPGTPVPPLDAELWAYCLTAPTYDPTLDISIVAPNGDHVAGCTAFPDYVNSNSEIERVCSRSDHRRMGLVEAAIRGCFRALDQAGLRTATITGDSDPAIRLYGKLGAKEEWAWHAWRLVVRRPNGVTGRGT
jgi:GNAT superfamily N-acetyltransferase